MGGQRLDLTRRVRPGGLLRCRLPSASLLAARPQSHAQVVDDGGVQMKVELPAHL